MGWKTEPLDKWESSVLSRSDGLKTYRVSMLVETEIDAITEDSAIETLVGYHNLKGPRSPVEVLEVLRQPLGHYQPSLLAQT